MPCTRLIVVLLVLPLAAAMWASQAATPQTPVDAGALPVSIERVHQRLQRPPLKIPPPDGRADFRVKIEEPGFPVETVLEAVRRELGAQPRRAGGPSPPTTPTGAPPLIVSPNLIDVAASIVKGIKDARRARGERRARQTVEEELAAFCAEHDCSVLEPGPASPQGN